MKILIAAHTHPYLKQKLEQDGFEVEYQPDVSYEMLMPMMQDVEGLVVSTKVRVDKNLIDKAENLKWIGRLGSGMELIDAQYALTKDIFCISTPEGNRQAVAEHALGMLLCVQKKIFSSHTELKQGIWERKLNTGVELYGKTVGIIGFGNTGNAFANLLKSFHVEILAHDKYKTNFAHDTVREVKLETVLHEADVVSLHLPYTSETHYYADEKFFNQLKKNPIFLNTSRGKITNSQHLLTALENNLVSGACLDVLENEELASYTADEKNSLNKLLSNKNVIITPHIAGYSEEANFKMAKTLLQKLGLD